MTTKEWHDFRLASVAPIKSKEQRFDLVNGDRIVRRDIIEKASDLFEVMQVSDLGDILIWTTSNVWCIRKEGGLEKLIYLPRNPVNIED